VGLLGSASGNRFDYLVFDFQKAEVRNSLFGTMDKILDSKALSIEGSFQLIIHTARSVFTAVQADGSEASFRVIEQYAKDGEARMGWTNCIALNRSPE